MLSNGKKVEEHIIDPEGNIIASRRQVIGSLNYFKGYFFYHHDLQGSTTAIVNDLGSRVRRYEYAPYGKVQINEPSTSTFITETLYTGHIKDATTPFTYMNARYYEPDVARFLTPDSYTGNPYNPNTQNVYSYTGGNPVNFVDPTGHIFISATLITIGITVASYITTTMSAPDFQLDLWELSVDIDQENWGMVAVDCAALLLPCITAGTGKGIVKGVDSVISSGLMILLRQGVM